MQIKKRTKLTVEENGGKCDGLDSEEKTCNTAPCPGEINYFRLRPLLGIYYTICNVYSALIMQSFAFLRFVIRKTKFG